MAELIFEDEYIGHIIKRGDRLELTIYRAKNGDLTFDFDQVERVFADVRERLA